MRVRRSPGLLRGGRVKRNISAVVAVVCGLVLVADVGAVLHLRAQEQAAVAAERARLDAAWADAVIELAVGVDLAQQPLRQALEFDLPGSEADDNVRYDVFVRGAAQADLSELLGQLAALPVPALRREQHDGLMGHLTRLRDTTAAMAPAEQPDAEFERLQDELLSTVGAFRQAVERDVRALPADRLQPQQPTTRAGLLYRWGQTCARGLDQLEDLPWDQGRKPEEFRQSLRTLATSMEAVLGEMLPVEPTSRDIAQLERDVRVPLRALQPTITTLRDLERAVHRRDFPALKNSLVMLDRDLSVLEQATRGLDAFGATTCASYFDPGLLAPDGQPVSV